MDIGQVAATAIIAALVTIGGSLISRRLRLGQTVDLEKADLIKTLQDRLELTRGDVAAAVLRADQAERRIAAAEDMADRTEKRRQACEDEIGRVRRDLRDTEAELLDLYRRTGKLPPRTLVARHQERSDGGD